ncbi:MAG: alpha/beta fold hydrolase [Pseudomonadota bacterium]
MTDFVLVHGAWHGGWCWRRVADILRTRGHHVTTPTMTGLGERSHLLSSEITLTTFGEDIRMHLEFEDLSDVVLVGHSFGGSPISYAAECAPARVQRLVYFDAQVVRGGETPGSCAPPEAFALREQMARDHDDGLSLPPPPAEAMGVLEAADAAWIERMMTPHPWRTFTTPLQIEGPPGAGKLCRYIACVEPDYTPLHWARERARDLGWPMDEIAAGHDAMVTAPEALADLLERA